MADNSDPRVAWRFGVAVLAVIPFIGLALTFTDPPTWLQVVGVVAIVTLVAVGSSLMRRRGNGWRPSTTLAPTTATRTDEH